MCTDGRGGCCSDSAAMKLPDPLAVRGISERLLFLFVLLGPIGTLIPIPGAPPSFRLVYLLLIPGIAYFLWKRVSREFAQFLAIFTPLALYCIASATYASVSDIGFGESDEAGNPLVRLALLASLATFVVLASETAERLNYRKRLGLVKTFLVGYFVSLYAGYVLFVGFQAGAFTEEFLQNFQILVQFGFGVLRFSPGSYPNEYGIVSSFALSLLLLVETKKGDSVARLLRVGSGSPIWRAVQFVLVLSALFLTTTRAAYVAFAVSIVYVIAIQEGITRRVKLTSALVGVLTGILALVQPYFDVIDIFVGAYEALYDESASAQERIVAWDTAKDLFQDRPIFGVGFGSVDMIHNVYLQFFYGLGFIGTGLVAATLALFWLTRRAGSSRRSRPILEVDRQDLSALWHIRNIGLIHVLWFAASNHSANHFLTWFVVLLVSMSRPLRKTSRPNPAMQPFSPIAAP